MALLQPTTAIYHHPLDTTTETIKSEAWTQSGGSFAAGKVVSGIFGSVGDALNTFGAEAEFLSAGGITGDTRTGKLSATTFVVVYGDGSDSNHGTAKIGTITGTNITFGVETEFVSEVGGVDFGEILVISATVFVVVYKDQAGGNHGTAKVGTVSGTTITFGAESEFAGASGANNISATLLSATSFAVVYDDSSDAGRGASKIGTISGTDIVFGAKANFVASGNIITRNCAVKLTATSFVIAYQDQTDSNHGTTKIATVSGTDIVFGAEDEFQSTGGIADLACVGFSPTSFVVLYRDGSDFQGTAKVGTVSGTDVVFGSETEFTSVAGPSQLAATKLSATSFVVVYRDDPDSGHGTAKIGTVSGTSVAFGTEEEYLGTAAAPFNSVAAFDTTSFVVSYQDQGDSQHGTSKVGALSAAASLTGTGASYDSVIGSTKLAYTGWLKNPSA